MKRIDAVPALLGKALIAGLARRAGVLAGLDVQSPQRVDLLRKPA